MRRLDVEGGRVIAAAASEGAVALAERLKPYLEPAGFQEREIWLLTRFPPIYSVTLAVVAGDAIGNYRIALPLWFALILGLVGAIAFIVKRPAVATGLALCAIMAAATIPAARILSPERGPDSLYRFADAAAITVKGRIVRAPEHPGEDRTYLFVDTTTAALESHRFKPVSGRLRITVLGDRHYLVGQWIRVTGRIRFPRNDGNPGEFDYRAYILRQGVAATMFAGGDHGRAPAITIAGYRRIFPDSEIQRVRDRIGDFIDANSSGDARAEMRALVIGDRGAITRQLRQRFSRTGMAHLLVISGLHLGFVAAAAFFVVRLLMGFFPTLMARGYGNKIAAGGAAVAVVSYGLIAGHHVSTMRALVMVLSYTLAIMIDRPREVLASLALAALIICLALPGSTADIGFQLSFVSVAVIILGMSRFARWWRGRYQPLGVLVGQGRGVAALEWIAGYIAVSFWAMLGTAPLTAYHFNQFSLVGLAANAVVVPVMGLGATVCALSAAALSFIYVPLAREMLFLAVYLANIGTALAGWFARWPMAWVRVFTPTLLELALAYGLLLLWLCWPARERASVTSVAAKTKQAANEPAVSGRAFASFEWRLIGLALMLTALIADAGWWTWQRYFYPDLRITFLSVGEGDAAVVRFPGGRVMLIDGGGSFFGSFDPGERIVAPYLWSRRIMHVDYIALSHPDRDHFGGLIFIARNFSPSQFWTTGVTSNDASYTELLDAIKQAGTHTQLVDANTPMLLIGGARVRCLGPPAGDAGENHNNTSMVLRMDYGHASFLFTGDLEAKGERELIESGADLSATVLKVPHHGSDTSSTQEFLKAIQPRVAVISLGYHNRFHFPAPEVVGRYKNDGILLLRTDQDGAVMADDSAQHLRLWSCRTGRVRVGR
ncbi:MAG: DNA internalization-related competence protein ComEC/Rec2 [Candidatus Binataceae bacterium]